MFCGSNRLLPDGLPRPPSVLPVVVLLVPPQLLVVSTGRCRRGHKGYMRVRAVNHCSLCMPWLRYVRGHCGGMHGSHCMRPFRHFMIGYLPSTTWSKGWSTSNCNHTNPLMRVLLDVIDLFLAKHCQLHHEIFYDLNL